MKRIMQWAIRQAGTLCVGFLILLTLVVVTFVISFFVVAPAAFALVVAPDIPDPQLWINIGPVVGLLAHCYVLGYLWQRRAR